MTGTTTRKVETQHRIRYAVGRTEDYCCCCPTRFCLIVVGLVGIVLYSIMLGLHFVQVDAVKEKVSLASKSDQPNAWYASIAFLSLMVAAHVVLVVGALLENSCLIWIFAFVDAIVTCVFIGLVIFLMVIMSGVLDDEEEIKKKCKEELPGAEEDDDSFIQCGKAKDEALIEVMVILGACVLLPTLIICLILTSVSCSYAQALADEDR